VGRHVPRSHRPRSTNQRPFDIRVIGYMDDHRVGRGLELGHHHPFQAEAAVNKTVTPPLKGDLGRIAGRDH